MTPAQNLSYHAALGFRKDAHEWLRKGDKEWHHWYMHWAILQWQEYKRLVREEMRIAA